MNKIYTVFIIVFMTESCFSQYETIKDDSLFLNIFSKIAFQKATDNKQMLRRWNVNIDIYIEGTDIKEIRDSLQKSISTIQPFLGGILIKWVKEKKDANYLIQLDKIGRNYYYLSWDKDGKIYNCRTTINTAITFSRHDQIMLARFYLLTALGHYYFPPDIKFPSLNSCLYSPLNSISDFDKKVLHLAYSKDLRSGMMVEEFNQLIR